MLVHLVGFSIITVIDMYGCQVVSSTGFELLQIKRSIKFLPSQRYSLLHFSLP